MNRYNKLLSIVLLLLFVLQPLTVTKVKAAETNSNVILLIDNSKSMRSTDPNRLSIVAASMLIDTLDDNTNLNIIPFGDTAQSPYKLSDKPSKDKLKEELSNIKFDSDYTNLKDGIKEALNQFENVDGEKIILVLSDGKEDPSGGVTDGHMNELYSLTDKAHDMNVKIHCIGLSNYADEETLSKITFKTGGDYFSCDNPAGLFNIFSKILGNINDFYTIDQFTTDTKKEKEIKFSSYIEEAIIKIASCDNKLPLVQVTQDGNELSTDKTGDKYKIYRIKNDKSSTIKITSMDEGKDSVIVQIKSKGKININSQSDNFSIPYGIPMDIEASLDIDKDISGLHFDKVEDGVRENINKTENTFKFTFKKDKAGEYPVLITAYDGDGNIIAVKDININVKNYTPFYYTETPPQMIIADKNLRIELKQQDNSKFESVSGEIYVDSGESHEEFPLKFENGILYSDVSLKKTGDIKLTTQINVIRDNESFSYYLPYSSAKVMDKPYVEIEGVKYKKPFKENDSINLKLNIKKNLTYENEKVSIYDDKNNKVGEFQITPSSKGIISVPVKALKKGRDISFRLKPEGEINITEKVNTNLSILSSFEYFLEVYKIAIIIVLAIIILTAVYIAVCSNSYIKYVEPYSINKEIQYNISSKNSEEILNITLSYRNNIIYLNLMGSSILADSYEENSIGYFTLITPEGGKLKQGFKYLLNKDRAFKIEYMPLMEQENTEGELITGAIKYSMGTELKLKNRGKTINIYFS